MDVSGGCGGEGDGLLIQLVERCSGVLSFEVTAEVELVVGLTREADDVWLSGAQQRVLGICTRGVVILLILQVGVCIGILLVVDIFVLVVVVPEELVGDLLGFVTASRRRILEGGKGHGGFAAGADVVELTQPVLVANLRVGAVLTALAAAVEVCDLTLLMRCHEFCGERQADALPALLEVHILLILRDALVPHAVAAVEVVGDRRVEVLLIYEEVVVGGRQVALHEVTID